MPDPQIRRFRICSSETSPLRRQIVATSATHLSLAEVTGEGGNPYHRCTTVIDCYSRRLVGRTVADHMRTELLEDAFKALVTHPWVVERVWKSSTPFPV